MDSNLKKNILIVACYINLSFASMTIDQQIDAIRDAPSHQRVKLMNNLKRELILMNQEERQHTIAKLRKNSPQTAPITPRISTRDRVEYRVVQSNENAILVTQEAKQQSINIINSKIPEIKTPEVKIPEQVPEINTPEIKVPEQVPEINTPEVKVPEQVPEINTPEVKVPEQVHEINTPEVKVPEQVPEINTPEVKVPENSHQEEQNEPHEPQSVQNPMGGNHS